MHTPPDMPSQRAGLTRRFYLALGALDALVQRAGEHSPIFVGGRLALIALAADATRDELYGCWRTSDDDQDREDALDRAEQRLDALDRALRGVLSRNAGTTTNPPVVQLRLREMLRSLVRAYGFRPGFVHDDFPPHQVPWTPLPFVAEVVHWLVDQGNAWLKKSIPIEAKQPGFINKHLTQIQTVAGVWRDGKLEAVKDNYEIAPPDIAKKAPDFFPPTTAAGLPAGLALKAAPSWQFWYSAGALAIHFDALAGAPTLAELWAESLAESAAELPQTIKGAVQSVTGVIGSLPWKPILIGAGGLVASVIVLPAILRRHRE